MSGRRVKRWRRAARKEKTEIARAMYVDLMRLPWWERVKVAWTIVKGAVR